MSTYNRSRNLNVPPGNDRSRNHPVPTGDRSTGRRRTPLRLTALTVGIAAALTGCGIGAGDGTESEPLETSQADQGNLIQEAPVETLEKALKLTAEGDLPGACEYVIIEDYEQVEAGHDGADPEQLCIDTLGVFRAMAGADRLIIDPASAVQVDPSPYGEGTVLLTQIQAVEGRGEFGCAVLSRKSMKWKWHMLESVNGGCHAPPHEAS